MRVLLVEDEEMIGQSLRDAFDASGWSVDWVKDGLLAPSALDDGATPACCSIWDCPSATAPRC